MNARSRSARRIAASIVAVTASALWLAGGVAAASDPPGNNGTVRVAGEDVGEGGTDSHVGCTFTVDFYGYDEGDLNAQLTIEGHEPTGGGTVWIGSVAIGEDAAGGGTDLDASAVVDLTDAFAGAPHETQGFHVKLTVQADGSQGENVKHKTFWVDCGSGDEGGGDEG